MPFNNLFITICNIKGYEQRLICFLVMAWYALRRRVKGKPGEIRGRKALNLNFFPKIGEKVWSSSVPRLLDLVI